MDRQLGDEGRAVEVLGDGFRLEGDLAVPDGASGIVLFAHGSGSRRHSSRNRFVARVLQEGGLATLLFDLLLFEEPGALEEAARLARDWFARYLTARILRARHDPRARIEHGD